ncbi:TIGR02679 family protein [Camelliibacillus cellulosilyticus]|uniref:TIGR02679 family protein n=1 Tax=Camelliibacillus cellulosilyticus TaxID=2174486 RepID=A0ABV9GT88_9BACL
MNHKLQVFRDEPGFLKLFALFKEKYRSLGRVGGTVSLAGFSREEIESIAGFLAESTDALQEKGKISLLVFEKALKQTPFADYTLVQLLEEVLKEPIVTKREESAMKAEREAAFLTALHEACPEGAAWWNWIDGRSVDTRWIWALYNQNAEDLYDKLLKVFQAFKRLPQTGQYERLPLFAQRTTGNPHFFDMNQTAGKLFLHCLFVDQTLNGSQIAGLPRTTEEINDLLGVYRLLRDDLWSFITCRGFWAETESGLHPVWTAAVHTDAVLNVPMRELIHLKAIRPAKGDSVWIVENSSVCSTLIDAIPGAPLVCTHGQFRTAAWLFFDHLVQCGVRLFYSGDLDPEGIAMADRLKSRYPDHVILWRMDIAAYQQSMSEEDVSSRLSKLGSVTAPELNDVLGLIKLKGKAGYQEALTPELIRDVKNQFSI